MLLSRCKAKVLVPVRAQRTSEQTRPHTMSLFNANKIPSRLNPSNPLAKAVSLGATETLKLQLTTIDGKKAKRPHQAFLTLSDPATGLEESFVLSVKDSGKGKVDLVGVFVQL
jgi:hypothetical protein